MSQSKKKSTKTTSEPEIDFSEWSKTVELKANIEIPLEMIVNGTLKEDFV